MLPGQCVAGKTQFEELKYVGIEKDPEEKAYLNLDTVSFSVLDE
jgi:hypothetical protein